MATYGRRPSNDPFAPLRPTANLQSPTVATTPRMPSLTPYGHRGQQTSNAADHDSNRRRSEPDMGREQYLPPPPPSTDIDRRQVSFQPSTLNADQQLNAQQLPARMRVVMGDSTFAPKPFNDDIDVTVNWLQKFDAYCNYRDIILDVDKLKLFSVLMTESTPAKWYRTLQDNIRNSWPRLRQAFIQQFGPTELDRINEAVEMWSRRQKPDEPVSKFVTAIRHAAQAAELDDERSVFIAIINGLRPEIKARVLASGASTLDELIRQAKIAEMSSKVTSTNNVQQVTVMTSANTNVTAEPENDFTHWEPIDAVANRRTTNSQQQSSGTPRFQQTSQQQPRLWSAQTTQQPRNDVPMARRYRQPPNDNNQTFNCGNCATLHQTGQCIAYGATCFNCGKLNHFSRCCRSRTQNIRGAINARQQYAQPHERDRFPGFQPSYNTYSQQ